MIKHSRVKVAFASRCRIFLHIFYNTFESLYKYPNFCLQKESRNQKFYPTKQQHRCTNSPSHQSSPHTSTIPAVGTPATSTLHLAILHLTMNYFQPAAAPKIRRDTAGASTRRSASSSAPVPAATLLCTISPMAAILLAAGIRNRQRRRRRW